MPRRREVAIRQLRLLSGDRVVDLLTRRPEDQWLDRTSARTDARHLAAMMVGFANAEGGLIVIGIHHGKVEGIRKAGIRAQNAWRQAALDFTEPAVRHTVELIDCKNTAGETDQIAVVEVESSDRAHTTVRGEAFLRVGDENRRLSSLEAQELRFDKGESSFDGLPAANARLSDLDATLVDQYVGRIGALDRADAALVARGLAVEKRGGLIPTTAGMLLLGSQPQQFFPEAVIRILRYRGSSRETGVRLNLSVDQRIEGAIPQQIAAARRVISRHLPRTTSLRRGGRFARTNVIPAFVWLEALVNAVTHRSYSIGGDHIRVEIFDDRLEVASPGRLPGLVRVDDLRSTRYARNPRIAGALSDIGYGRELGEGVNRMFEEMNRAGLPDPVYRQGSASVQVTLLADPVVGRVLDHLPPGSARFAEHLSRTGRVTTSDAVALFGASRPTVLKYLHGLARRGLIEHTGTSLKDPRGTWRLVTSDARSTRRALRR